MFQLLPWSLLSLLQPSLPLLFCFFLLSPLLPLPLLEEVSYDSLFKSSKPPEGGPFRMGFPIPLPFLPNSPNPFLVLFRGSSNPFEERVQDSSPTGGPAEVEIFFCKKVKELTTPNLLLAMQIDKLK